MVEQLTVGDNPQFKAGVAVDHAASDALSKEANAHIASSDKQAQNPPADSKEGVGSKLLREGEVIGLAAGKSVLDGFYNIPDKLPQLGESMAIGVGLSALSRMGTEGKVAAYVAGAFFASRFIVNTYNDHERWSKAWSATTDTWQSDQHIRKNINDLSNTAGSWAFDTALFTGAGYLGYNNPALGNSLLGVFRLPIPTIPVPPLIAPIAGLAPPYSHENYSSDGSTGSRIKYNFGLNLSVDFGRDASQKKAAN